MKKPRPEPLLSLVIPAYNEADNIQAGALSQVGSYLAEQDYESELIVVDDGSEDSTPALVEKVAAEYPFLSLIRNEHRGKTQAVRAGVMAARGRYVVFADMDLSTPIHYVGQCLEELQGGHDVVVGSREIEGSARLGEPLSRLILGKLFGLLVRALLLPDIRDSQCGFKGFRREVGHELFRSFLVFGGEGQATKGPMVTAFDVELLLLARKRNYSIKEIPVTWRHVKTSRVNPLRDSLRMFRQLLQVCISNLKGKYGPTS